MIEEEYQSSSKIQANLLETQLIEAIADSMQNHLDTNATFLAERLVYERDTEEFRSILAECYFREQKPYKAVAILRDCKNEYNRYQLALAYFRIHKFKEAEQVLCGNTLLHQFTTNQAIPNGGFGHYLLGLIYENLHRIDEAKTQYSRALDVNPTLWMAFEKLSRIGEMVQINKVFNDQKQKQYEVQRTQSCNILKSITNIKKTITPKSGQKEQEDIEIPLQQENMTSQRARQINKPLNPFGDDSGKKKPIIPLNFLGPPSYKQTYQKTSQVQKVSSTAINTNLPQLLKQFAHPFYLWCTHNTEAISNFQKLPQQHQKSGWVLEKIARSLMDQVKYSEAEKVWKELREVEPYRLEGMDYYSSCLWHLRKQVDLTYLAHGCMQTSTNAPETWVAIGNCFSLMKEIDNSLKFFQRAIYLRPEYSYAQTLSGHEYSQNENFQAARKCYEQAIQLDHRQYNAWWGQGNMHYKQDKYDEAIKCFQAAIKINQNNPVLPTFLAMSFAAKGDHLEALKYFQISEKLDPVNSLNRYQKANTLVKLEYYEDALKELDRLSKQVPKEAPIHILMGRIFKKLGNTQEAQKCFTTAQSLDPKDQSKIRGLIEGLHNQNAEFNDDFDL
ncbi:hypothetical protein pb186bvf_013456 [Paramecium bursaria]